MPAYAWHSGWPPSSRFELERSRFARSSTDTSAATPRSPTSSARRSRLWQPRWREWRTESSRRTSPTGGSSSRVCPADRSFSTVQSGHRPGRGPPRKCSDLPLGCLRCFRYVEDHDEDVVNLVPTIVNRPILVRRNRVADSVHRFSQSADLRSKTGMACCCRLSDDPLHLVLYRCGCARA